MKHLNKLRVLSFLAMLMIGGLASTASAQNATIAEPDSTAADLMYLVDADNSLRALPQESGQMEHHKNKLGKLASIVGTAANAAGALGGIGALAGANSISTLKTGIQVMGTASNLKVNNDGKDVRVLINLRGKKHEDGLTLFKVVRFTKSKKDRRLQWFQTKAALINTENSDKADKAGYLSFGYQSYGDHSSVITIPAAQLKTGEYGVFYLGNMITPTLTSLCYTFSVE